MGNTTQLSCRRPAAGNTRQRKRVSKRLAGNACPTCMRTVKHAVPQRQMIVKWPIQRSHLAHLGRRHGCQAFLAKQLNGPPASARPNALQHQRQRAAEPRMTIVGVDWVGEHAVRAGHSLELMCSWRCTGTSRGRVVAQAALLTAHSLPGSSSLLQTRRSFLQLAMTKQADMAGGLGCLWVFNACVSCARQQLMRSRAPQGMGSWPDQKGKVCSPTDACSSSISSLMTSWPYTRPPSNRVTARQAEWSKRNRVEAHAVVHTNTCDHTSCKQAARQESQA